MAAKQDLVIASVPYRLEAVEEILKSAVPFLGLEPKCLDDIYKDMMMIARIVSSQEPAASEARGTALVERMRNEIAAVQKKTSGVKRPLVYCEEWGKPLILSQTWVAELVDAAGGHFFGQARKQT